MNKHRHMNAGTYSVPAEQLATFRRRVLRAGMVVVCSAPIRQGLQGDAYVMTVAAAGR